MPSHEENRPIRVLIVDDDEVMRLICRRSFERSTLEGRIEITEAGSGEAAIDLLKTRDFDCILSDYGMGAVTGIDVLAFGMQHRPKAVRIMMSGSASPDLIKAALSQARVHEFIEKPMTTEELHSILQEVVMKRYLEILARSDSPTRRREA